MLDTDPSNKVGLKDNFIVEDNKELDNFDLAKVRITNPVALFFRHFNALFLKRVRYFRRDIRGLMCEIFLPCIIIVLGLAILLITFINDSPSIVLTPDMYDNPIKTSINSNVAFTKSENDKALISRFDTSSWDIS